MVEERTREKSKFQAWFDQCACRITASKLCEALHISYLVSLIKAIYCIYYPEQRKFTSSACQYGYKHEDIVRVVYTEKMLFMKILVIQCNLILDPGFPFMGATPVGLVYCKCCESCVLEIKCPFSCKNKALAEVILDIPLFLGRQQWQTCT